MFYLSYIVQRHHGHIWVNHTRHPVFKLLESPQSKLLNNSVTSRDKLCGIQTLVTDHQRRPNKDRFVLKRNIEENGQSTNLCESNQSAIHVEGRRIKPQ